MNMMMYMLFMTSLLMIILILIINMVSKKTIHDREKSSPFECGFDPKSSPRLPFSLHFFMIAIIFLIFDIEITLILPLIISMTSSNMKIYLLISISFIFILIIGLIHEWIQGALNWVS